MFDDYSASIHFFGGPYNPCKTALKTRGLTTRPRARRLISDKMSGPPRRRVVAAPTRKPPAELRAVRAIVEDDPSADVAYLREEGFEERRKAHERGELGFICVRLEADVLIEGTDQTLLSPGLGGIESDLSEAELTEIVGDEWFALRNVLKTIGAPTNELPLEANVEWIEWRTS